jgi:glucose uptake protein GlcU
VLLIFAGTIVGVFMSGDDTSIAQTVGGVIALAGLAGGYFFSSSSGSRTKDTAIANLSGTKPTTQAPETTNP